MVRRFHLHSISAENTRLVLRTIPWKLLILVPLLLAVGVPSFLYASNAGKYVVPTVTDFFYSLSAPPVSPTPTPLPAFPTTLPQMGSVLYMVQSGDSCDSILTFQMRMVNAGQVFSDSKPSTVKALNASLGQDCHRLQPGMVLPLSPQYPLLAFGGVVQKIEATSTQQLVPTPLIKVTSQPQLAADCSGGCNLTVRIAPNVQVHLAVQTTLAIRNGSWVWTQAMLARKNISGFAGYPYADPNVSLDGMSLRACDFQVDDIHDDNSLSCSQLMPNSIEDDGGAWLFGVTGSSALDHWHYQLPSLPSGTQVLIWLTNDRGNLKFDKGFPVFRYDDTSHVYVKV